MRKIEQQMLVAIKNKKTWRGDNTEVVYLDELDESLHARMEMAKVYLYNHHIGTYVYKYKVFHANPDTLAKWPTPTTKSRLRALGVDVHTKNHTTYLNGKAV
jgi:hypothetical protein